MSDQSRPQRILFLCTANICRSPAAEYLARDRFGSDRFVFRSAGFLESGRQSPPELIQALGDRGISVGDHRSYQVDVASLRAADLVLTMEGAHVPKATALWSEVWDKILPLREAATLLDPSTALDPDDIDGRPPASVADFLTLVRRQREPADYLGSRWDVADPFRRNLKVYRRAVTEIENLLEVVFSALR